MQLFRQYPAHLRPSLLQDSNLEFFINQINLIKNLDVETQKDLVIRLPYSATSDFNKKILVINFPKINFVKFKKQLDVKTVSPKYKEPEAAESTFEEFLRKNNFN